MWTYRVGPTQKLVQNVKLEKLIVKRNRPLERVRRRRTTLKQSRRLQRGWTLTDHINHRIRQNQKSIRNRNEFLPTGKLFIFINMEILYL